MTPREASSVLTPPSLEPQALCEFIQALCAIHDLDLLVRFIRKEVAALLDVEASSVIFLDEKKRELCLPVAEDLQPAVEPPLRELRFPADSGIVGWVIRKGATAVVPDVDQDPRFCRMIDGHTDIQTKSFLCAPLQIRGRILGVLTAINKRQRPFDSEDVRLLQTVASPVALAVENLWLMQAREENLYLREELGQATQSEALVAESHGMQEVYRLIQRVLNTTVTVLITGESGTGKELIARVIHAEGPRAKGPFIAVNCAAIPETLLEAELFGYEKGAFTGAGQRKPGRFELANGGTLFLDEIGELNLAVQVKLLRVLQEQCFERVGGTATITTDARIIAATNRDLKGLMAEGKFREDLFYRLNVFPIPVPPLRERKEALLPLTLHFLSKHSRELQKEVSGLAKEVVELLRGYDWPGNVRELENVIQRAVILCQGPLVTIEDLPLSLRERQKGPLGNGKAFRLPPGGILLAEMEKQLVCQALEQAHGNKSEAGRLLGLSRTQLRTRVKKYGVQVTKRA